MSLQQQRASSCSAHPPRVGCPPASSCWTPSPEYSICPPLLGRPSLPSLIPSILSAPSKLNCSLLEIRLFLTTCVWASSHHPHPRPPTPVPPPSPGPPWGSASKTTHPSGPCGAPCWFFSQTTLWRPGLGRPQRTLTSSPGLRANSNAQNPPKSSYPHKPTECCILTTSQQRGQTEGPWSRDSRELLMLWASGLHLLPLRRVGGASYRCSTYLPGLLSEFPEPIAALARGSRQDQGHYYTHLASPPGAAPAPWARAPQTLGTCSLLPVHPHTQHTVTQSSPMSGPFFEMTLSHAHEQRKSK